MTGPRPARWFAIGSADLVFLAFLPLVFLSARKGMLDDPGLGWHLRNIDAMLGQGGWLTHDPFSDPRGGQPWRTNQWLGELPLWLGWRWAGLEGIAAVTSVVIALMLRCLYRMHQRDGLSWPVALGWTFAAALATQCAWVARPNVFTMFFVLLVARVCVRLHEGGSRAASFWLVPLFAVWANVHGGFLAGFILLGTSLITEAVLGVLSPDGQGRGAARDRAVHLVILTSLCVLATLANPYGVSLYPWLLGLLRDSYFMGLHHEWRTPNFHEAGSYRFEIVFLLFPALLAVSRRRPTAAELMLSLVWMHEALTGFRYVPLFVVVVVPLLARQSTEIPWLAEWVRRFLPRGLPRGPRAAPWAATLVGAIGFVAAARGVEGTVARHDPRYIPAEALDAVLRLHSRLGDAEEPARVFHAYDWGGYLTWHGWPAFRNWIDDRNEVQGRGHVEDYFALVRTVPGWEEQLNKNRIAIVCIQPDTPLAWRLAERPRDWEEVKCPGGSRFVGAAIFRRAPQTGVARSFQPSLNPSR